jgi:concanavalin A-like lectin/glucanase superfamily protein
MSILDEFLSFVRDPALGLYLLKLPILGNLDSYDSYQRTTAIAGTPYFRKCRNGYGLNQGTTGEIEVAHGAEQQGTEGTIFIGTEGFKNMPATTRFVSKRAVAHFWAFFYQNGDRFNFYNGVTSSFIVDIQGNFSTVANVYESGSEWQCYLGKQNNQMEFAGLGSVAHTLVPNTETIKIGNYFSGGGNQNSDFQSVALFSAQLTSRQLSDLHLLFDALRINVSEPLITRARMYQVVDQLVRLDGSRHEGQVFDHSGNGIHFDHTVGVGWEKDTPSGGTAVVATGAKRDAAKLTANDAQLDNTSSRTFAFWIRRDGDGEIAGRIFDKASTSIELYITNGSLGLTLREQWTGGAARWIATPAVLDSVWTHCVIRMDGIEGTVPSLLINGNDFPFIESIASSGTKLNDAGQFTLLDRVVDDREFSGALDDFQMWDRYLTDEEALSTYLRAALRVVDRGYEHIYPDSLVSLSVGNVGPWSISNGILKWDSNVLVAQTNASRAHMSSQQVYGFWYFKFKKVTTTARFRYMFIASLPEIRTASGQNCYELYIHQDNSIAITRWDNGGNVPFTTGSISTSIDTINVDETTELGISRDADGVFTLWMRQPSGIWAELGSATDNTHKLSNYMVGEFNNSDEAESVLNFPYGMGLTPNKIPWLTD